MLPIPRIPAGVSLPRTSLWFNLEVAATRYPDKTAVVYCGQEITYARLHADAQALAGWLRHHAGVRQGDRVGLYLQNSPQWIIAFYGILRADAVVVPISPMNREGELAHIVNDAGLSAAICGHEVIGRMAELADLAMPLVAVRYLDIVETLDPAQPLPEFVSQEYERPPGTNDWRDVIEAGHRCPPGEHRAGPDDMAVLPYTSGTTGAPKGCVHLHRNVMHNIVANVVWSGSHSEGVVLTALPLYHVAGMLAGMHNPIFAGATVVLQPRWNREDTARLIERYGVTYWSCITTMLVDFLEMRDLQRYDLSSLQRIGGGGAPMPAAVGQRLQNLLGLEYAEGYGLTETMGATHRNPRGRGKLQCLGMPFVGTDARIIDPDTGAQMPQGQHGEIVVCGPQVFQGYWGRPDATAAAFMEIDGKSFFRTGDIGYVDDEGYFFLTDRIKRMINASGFKVWPAEVESTLYQHPRIREACVIARRDPYRGETVKAVVVLREEGDDAPSEADIIEWSRERLAAYKCPRYVEFVPELPRSNTGKIMWRTLQEQENRQQDAGAVESMG